MAFVGGATRLKECGRNVQEMSWSMGDTGIGSSLLQESTDADEHTSLTMHSQMNPVTNYGSSEPAY